MKYMGHKGKMLPVLGEVIKSYAQDSISIADPFCGSAAVSWYLAENTDKSVLAGDLQSFAVTRAASIIERDCKITDVSFVDRWFQRARLRVSEVADHFPNDIASIKVDLEGHKEIRKVVNRCRKFCDEVLPVVFFDVPGQWPISKAYGGHYFSPLQALTFDALRQTLPRKAEYKNIAYAALVEALSKCAASPGHTAQPFQPTISAARYIFEAWRKNPWLLVENAAKEISSRSARIKGRSVLGGFENTISLLSEGDLVFADPPYSGVHYSRFYHVLETIIRGREFIPIGAGRYPSISERPSSDFSKKGTSLRASRDLLEMASKKKLKLILTFPSAQSSNGLSVKDFVDFGRNVFSTVIVEEVKSDFSTLGGNSINRRARIPSNESIVCFLP